jgi:hypothetical protein
VHAWDVEKNTSYNDNNTYDSSSPLAAHHSGIVAVHVIGVVDGNTIHPGFKDSNEKQNGTLVGEHDLHC